jgi:signal transduction histidine kinase
MNPGIKITNDLHGSMDYFTLIFDQHYDAIILLKKDFSCSYMNNPAKNFFNRSGSGIPAKELFSDLQNFEKFKKTVREHHPNDFLINEIYLKANNQSYLPSSIKGKLINLMDREEIFCSIRDITKKIEIEEKQKKLQAKLIQTNKITSLGTMASGVGHEINNPNNYILSNAQILLDIWNDLYDNSKDFLHPVGQDIHIGGFEISEIYTLFPKLLNSIIKGSNRITGIVNQLRDFSKPAGKESFSKVNIQSSLELVQSMLRNQIMKKTKHFTVNLVEDLPVFYGDQKQIEQVIINLCQNSLNALKSREDKVDISVFPSKSRDQIIMEFKDTGIGIKKEHLERIKEPFFTTRQNSGGTGLGLYICHSIIESHYGDLEISSQEGKGTLIRISLPVHPPGKII